MQDFAFFKKAEKVLKARQVEPAQLSTTQDTTDSGAKRTKNSLAKLITNSEFGEDNVDLEIKISLPCLARGKSNHLLNNTLFLKKLSSLENDSQLDGNVPLLTFNSMPA